MTKTILEESTGYLVSADGLEPSTHALKGRRLRVLPRGTNDLTYRTTVPIGAKHPQSAVNLQLIYILASRCFPVLSRQPQISMLKRSSG